MDFFHHLEDFIGEIAEADHLNDVFAALARETRRLGFDMFTYWLWIDPDGPRTPLYLTNYPPEWSRTYRSHDFKSHDIVRRVTTTSATPFLWADVTRLMKLNIRENEVLQGARDMGLRAGGSVPIHGPGGTTAALSVTNDAAPDSFARLFTAHRHHLFLLSTYAHEQVLCMAIQRSASEVDTLTAREREVLTWAARGKTEWETSVILSIAESTVKSHLKASRQKLNVSNTPHAVAVSLLNGHILP